MAHPSRFALLTAPVALLLLPLPAFAYIDPNTGGMLFQVLAPILAMITSAWLFLRDRIKSVWYALRRRLFPARADTPMVAGTEEAR